MPGFQLSLLDSAGNVERAFPLADTPFSIGRHPDNNLVLTDDLASRFHAAVEPDGSGGWRVRDLGSRNGTRVNDEKVADHTLRPGDRIRVGQRTLRLDHAAKPAPAKAQAKPAAPRPRPAPTPSHAPPQHDHEPSPFDALEPADIAFDALPGDEAPANRPAPQPHAPPDAPDTGAWDAELRQLARSLGAVNAPEDAVAMIDARGKRSEVFAQEGGGATAMRYLLMAASRARATDIHVEPKGQCVNVRFRVDGQMLGVVDLPNQVGEMAVGLVKAACHMKTAGRDAVLDGHFSSLVGPRRLDLRASLTPSVHGQKLVLRVLNSIDAPESLRDLQLPPYMHERIRRTCDKDAGLLLVCGPTGCGKTTTLYNALREIDRERRNVITIEDPIEHHLDKITQIPVNSDTGSTFGSLLRSVLRQDPDVILVGEIRDDETARVAMQAAMTGHLVFSTVHSKDTIGAVFRLLDLGVEPYLVANSLDLIVAQRLVRVLCEHCKRPVRVTPGQATRMGKFLENKHEIYSATGCARCLRTGFRGRHAIFEMLEFTNELRDVVLKEPTIQAMRRVIEQGLFTTLQQSGWQLVARGATTLDEVDRVAGVG